MATSPDPLRAHLASLLDWEQAHVGFEKAVDGIPAGKRGAHAPGFQHTLWQLLEHIRLAQHDLLDYCVNPQYVHALSWPDDYWPADPAPPSASAWTASIRGFLADRQMFSRLVRRADVDLLAPVPTGKKRHTFLRAVLLAADHTSYHLGQIVAVRRALGIWK